MRCRDVYCLSVIAFLLQLQYSPFACLSATIFSPIAVNHLSRAAVVKPALVRIMEITCSPNWMLDQNRGESLSLQPSLKLSDDAGADPSKTLFEYPSFILELDTATYSGKDPAWIEIDCELPATPTIVSQIAIQTNARFVELYADGNYLTTLKGTCRESTDGAVILFTHEHHQRFTYSKLRLKFLSIKTNKLPTESKSTGLTQLHLAHLSLTVAKQTERQPKIEPRPSTNVSSFVNGSLNNSSNCGMGQMNMSIGGLLPPHLLSMMSQGKAPQAQSLRGKTSVEEQHRNTPNNPAQQKNPYSEMAIMKTMLMADIANLMDVKLAPLFTRMDLLQNRIEELVVIKTAAEQLRMEKCNAVIPESNSLSDASPGAVQRTVDDVPLAAASNVSDSACSIQGHGTRREMSQNERIPSTRMVIQSRGKDSSVGESTTYHASEVSTTSEKPLELSGDAASVKEDIEDGKSGLDQLTECMNGSNDEDALKGDMRDLMRLLRGSHVLPCTDSSVPHIVDNSLVKIS